MTEAFNVDCMEYMRSVPDKYFDLAVVDPPYGDAGGDLLTRPALASGLTAINRGGWHGKQKYHLAPGPEYFEELLRVSRNQIIWGGNYFYLPPTRFFLYGAN